MVKNLLRTVFFIFIFIIFKEGKFNGKNYIHKACDSVENMKTQEELKEHHKDIKANNCITLNVDAPGETNGGQKMKVKGCICSTDL